jgi:hypothetical protein
MELTFEYDAEEDTLYAWVGDGPQPAITYETDEGHLVRLDPDTKAFVGVTIFDFQARWSDEPISLSWNVEIEKSIPWIPRLSRKRRERIQETRLLHRDHVTA